MKGVVGKVALGQADAGFVYVTDVKPVADDVTSIRIPAWAQPRVAVRDRGCRVVEPEGGRARVGRPRAREAGPGSARPRRLRPAVNRLFTVGDGRGRRPLPRFLLLPIVAIFSRVPLGRPVLGARLRARQSTRCVTVETNLIALGMILLVGTPTAWLIATRAGRLRPTSRSRWSSCRSSCRRRSPGSGCSPRSAASASSAGTSARSGAASRSRRRGRARRDLRRQPVLRPLRRSRRSRRSTRRSSRPRGRSARARGARSSASRCRSPRAGSAPAPRSRSPAGSASSARRSCSPAACGASPRRCRSRSTRQFDVDFDSRSRSAPCSSPSAPRSCSRRQGCCTPMALSSSTSPILFASLRRSRSSSRSARETVALVGPSGAGKTTVLRAVAGLVRPARGRIVARRRDAGFDAEQRVDLPPERRRVGLVFQDYALFPHLTVAPNVGLRRPGRARTSCSSGSASRTSRRRGRRSSPAASASASRSRVRSRASPRVLLLDEPMAALDAHTRAGRPRRAAGAAARARPADAARHARLRGRGRARRPRRRDLRRAGCCSSARPTSSSRAPADAFVASFTGGNLLHGFARSARGRADRGRARRRRGRLLDRPRRGSRSAWSSTRGRSRSRTRAPADSALNHVSAPISLARPRSATASACGSARSSAR